MPAQGRHEARLEVTEFGRYAITVRSAQGIALQLVDRMAGPGGVAGRAGEADGRLEAFLDRGSYKLVTTGPEPGSGEAALEVHPFAEKSGPHPPQLIEEKLVSAALADFEQVSYWLQVGERRRVALEAAGRNLADLRLWQGGTWLADVTPEREVIEPSPGRPLLACRVSAELEPGLYLITAYGGAGQAWAEGGEEHPLYLRLGIPSLGEAGRERFVASPFGTDRFLVPPQTTYFRLELPEARDARLQVGTLDESNPFHSDGTEVEIGKKSRPPVAETLVDAMESGKRVVEVTAAPGQPYVLQQFDKRDRYTFRRSGEYWLSTIASGHPADSIDATVVITRSTDEAQTHEEPFLDQVVELDPHRGWARRCNLLDPLTVFVKVGTAGKYEVLGRGVQARFRIEPFFTGDAEPAEPAPLQPSGASWDLDRGYYILSAVPEKKGIVDLAVRPVGLPGLAPEALAANGGTPLAPGRAAACFPRVTLDADRTYTAYLNDQPGVSTGVVLRPLPLDLTEPLPLAPRPGESIAVPFSAAEPVRLVAATEDGGALEVAVDGGAAQASATAGAGAHTVTVRNPGGATVVCSLRAEPVRLLDSSPLPELPAAALAALPAFPPLAAGAPAFLDLARGATATFLVRAARPALYRLESTGLLATTGNLRTRTVLSLDRQSGSGIGRNFLIQQYLRDGDYQLTVAAEGESAGHLGVALSETPILDGGALEPGLPARVTLPPGRGVAYRFHVAVRGEYRLDALGLGRRFRCRLEDGEGWPVEASGITAALTRTFDPGDYRLVLLPEAVTTRRVTRLEKVAEKLRFTGHGPHPLPLDQEVEHLWQEPAQGAERVPDAWLFTLPAPAAVRVELSGEMEGKLNRVGDGGAEADVAALSAGKGWRGELAAGSYRLAASCARRNNLLAYRVGVMPEPLVAGLSREVVAPATVPVSVGAAGLYELSSFGDADVRARLLDAGGRLVAANDDRPDDWNFDLAQQLAPGRYALAVAPVARVSARCTVTMRAPGEVAGPALRPPARQEVATGRDAHVFPLDLPSQAQLLVVAAHSAESVACALERKEGASWRSVASDAGRDPRLEVPLAGAGEWRLRLWSADQRGLPATLTVVAATPPTVHEEQLARGAELAPVAGSDPRVGALAVALQGPGVFRFEGASRLRTAEAGGAAAAAPESGVVTANTAVLWLVGDLPAGAGSSRVRASRVRLEPGAGAVLRAPLSRSRPLTCDLAAAGAKAILAVAATGAGQPGVRIAERRPTIGGAVALPIAGAVEAVGRHAAVAVALAPRAPQARVWMASGGEEAVELRLQQHTFALPEPEPARAGWLDGALSGEVARVFALPAGAKRVRLALGEATVGVLSNGSEVASVHWMGGGSFAETVETTATRLTLLHARAAADEFDVEVLPLPALAAAVAPDRPFASVETAAGVLRLTVAPDAGGSPAATLHVRGGDGEVVLLGGDGRVRRGADLPLGPAGGTLLVSHERGRVLAWIDRPGGADDALWAGAAATAVAAPALLPLAGRVQRLAVGLGGPGVLHVRGATPLATRLTLPGGAPVEDVHPNGCTLDAYLPDGSAELALRSVDGGELAGTIELTASRVTPIDEGLGPELLLAPGETRFFSFVAARSGPVGVGVRADSDAVRCRLLDASGKLLKSGVVAMANLDAGAYLLAVRAPATSRPVRARPAVAGIKPPGTGPPEEVVRHYLRLAHGEADDAARPAAGPGGEGEEANAEEAAPGEDEPAEPEEPQS
ncbi:MAG TPA: hypothetical protein VLW17_12805 [Thermoanaerobaculaceae bacterium]|nr:hypothetical protein [Thermoanaerobaculaceae bacterium]